MSIFKKKKVVTALPVVDSDIKLENALSILEKSHTKVAIVLEGIMTGIKKAEGKRNDRPISGH